MATKPYPATRAFAATNSTQLAAQLGTMEQRLNRKALADGAAQYGPFRVRRVSTTYYATPRDYLVLLSSTAFNVWLPPSMRGVASVRMKNDGAATVTVYPQPGETIDQALGYNIVSGAAREFYPDPANGDWVGS